MDQRGQLAIIKFLAKEGCEPDEIADRLIKVFGDDALPGYKILELYDKVDGREDQERFDDENEEDVYLLDETQFKNPDYLSFDDDYDEKADTNDLYDEKVPNLPPYIVYKFGKYEGYTKVPITTPKGPTWTTTGRPKPLVTWTTPKYTPMTKAHKTTTPIPETTPEPGKPREPTPQPTEVASNFPEFIPPWVHTTAEPSTTTPRSVQDSNDGKVTQKHVPAWVPWWKTTPHPSHRVTTPTGPTRQMLFTLSDKFTTTRAPPVTWKIPVAARARIVEPETQEPKDEVHQVFEFTTVPPRLVLPHGEHKVEQTVHSNTIFLKVHGGQVFNAKVDTSAAKSLHIDQEDTQVTPATRRPRPFFRHPDESRSGTRTRVWVEHTRGRESQHGYVNRGQQARGRTSAPKPVIIRHGNRHFHGPTFKCRILNPVEDGRPAPNTDPTCNLVYPGFSADGSCHCTYAVENRDADGCATGFLYTCLRVVPAPSLPGEEFSA